MNDESDLPDELQGESGGKGASASDVEKLEALGKLIASKRDDAVKARKSSGIEDVWLKCEQSYISMDEANAHEFAGAKWAKPLSPDGPVTREIARPDDTKSTAFIPLTARYVDAAAAMVSEIILPVDGKAFGFTSTPVPELVDASEDMRQVVDDAPGGTGAPLTRPATPDDQAAQQPAGTAPQAAPQSAPAQGQPAAPQVAGQPAAQVPLTVADLAKEKLELAAKMAEKAEARVYDWMVQAKYPMQMRKVVFDSARIGVGVLKGPFPNQRRKRALETAQDGGVKLTFLYETMPDAKRIDAWNFFPEDGCGENIHDGDWCFERDFLSPGKLRELKNLKTSDGQPIYLSDAIDKVLDEGPEKLNTEVPRIGNETANKKRFAIWYCYGTLDKDDLDTAGTIGTEDLPADAQRADVLVTLVNDTVIASTLNPLDSGNFPYRVLPWSLRDGSWTGRGVGEQITVAQRITNAGTRRMLENAGKSAGCQFVIDPDSISPADGVWAITPDKIWTKNPDATMDDVRKAFMSVQIQNVTEQLMSIIQYGFKIAEEASSIPLVTQGHEGETAPQTFGQADLQNSNAHTMLRAKAYAVDDCITEPLVNDYYDWLLMDPSVPNDEKGDFDIDAHGSIVMVERAIQEVFQLQIGEYVINPAYGLNARRWIEEVMKAKRLNVEKIKNTDAEQQKIDSQPPPEDPRVTAANIMAKSKDADTAARKDRDTVFAQVEMDKNSKQHDERMQEFAVKKEIALLEYSLQEKINLDTAKTQLAETTMKLNVQRELSTQADAVDLHKHLHPQPDAHKPVMTPPTEPSGRATDGQAFAQ